MRVFWCIALAFFVHINGNGQNYTEEEVNLEQLIIEANQLRLLEKFEQSLSKYQEVVRLDRTIDVAHYEIARIQLYLDNKEGALNAVKKAIDLAPNNQWYIRLLAQIYTDNGYYEDAALLYTPLIRRFPKLPDFYYEQSDLFVKAGLFDKAIQTLADLQREIGINETTAKRRHVLFLEKGKTKEAGQELEALVNAFPNQIAYKLLLAKFYEQFFDRKAANKVYQAILAIDPNHPEALSALAGEGATTNKSSNYVASLMPLFTNPQVDIDLKMKKILPQIQMVSAQFDQAKVDELLQLTNTLETIHPDEAKGFAATADLYFLQGKWLLAKEKYKATLDKDDTVFPVWSQYLQLLNLSGEFQEMEEAATTVLDYFPNQPLGYYYYGLANIQLQNPDPVLEVLPEALWMTGKDQLMAAQIHALLGIAHGLNNDKPSADDAFGQMKALNVQNPIALAWYGQYLAQNGNLAQAKTHIEQAINIDHSLLELQFMKANILMIGEDFKGAKTLYEGLFEREENQLPGPSEKYGDVWFQLGDTDEALVWWKKALELGNNNPILKKKIADRKWYE